jgi:protein TonB
MRTVGTVSVDVVLDESGKVVSAVATSGPTILREAAVQAARRARFSPTKLSGQPVKVSGVINYKFALAP